MFVKPTVFILGAGASWHYGYPTGSELIEEVVKKAQELLNKLEAYSQVSRGSVNYSGNAQAIFPQYILDKIGNEDTSLFHLKYAESIQECKNLISRIEEANPLVIDHFMNYNRDLSVLTKMLIAQIILECEKENETKKLHLERGNWCRYLVHQMMIGCDDPNNFIDNNNVSFVIFNYDLSLENMIKRSLSQNTFFAKTDIVDQFMDDQRFIHVYGKIEDHPYQKPEMSFQMRQTDDLSKYKKILDPAYEVSKGIHTIAPLEKLQNADEIELAKEKLEEAECVYILGYGFDKMNNSNLNLYDILNRKTIMKKHRETKKGKSVFFTNFGNHNIVSKRASQIFQKDDLAFLPPNGLISERQDIGWRFEMSTKNVEKALSEDFELIE